MRVMAPIAMTDAQLDDSNVSEDDHAEWDISTSYDTGNRVISLTTHRIYESLTDSNLGNDPTTDTTNWLEISATNRWKAFDGKLADQVSRSANITYSIIVAKKVTGIAFFNVDAPEIRVRVYNDSIPEEIIYNRLISLVDDSDIVDWYTFFTTELDQFETSALFADLPALPGYRIAITVGDGTGTPKVGEIAFGNIVPLGETLEGTTLGLRSFSTKEQDDFGNWNIVSRAKSDPIDFVFAMASADAGRVRRVLSSVRDTPAVYFADASLTSYGALVYGLFQDYEIPLQYAGKSVVTLEIEGLT